MLKKINLKNSDSQKSRQKTTKSFLSGRLKEKLVNTLTLKVKFEKENDATAMV